MIKKDSLRFKVSISARELELYGYLEQFGPYYRSRRLLDLARIGYAVQKGGLLASMPFAPTESEARTSDESLPTKPTHYKINEDAARQIAEMLGSLDNWGTA